MKKRYLSIMLVLLMLLTTAGTCVFAIEDIEPAVGNDAEAAVQEDLEEAAEEAVDAAEMVEEDAAFEEMVTAEAMNAEGEETVTPETPAPAPAPPVLNKLKAYPAYQSVALEWDPVPGATSYNVSWGGKTVSVPVTSRAYDNAEKMAYICKKLKDDTSYTFTVAAVGANMQAATASVTSMSVKQMYIKIKFKGSARLTSHDNAKKTRTFKAGQVVKAYGFGGGKYRFVYKGNHYFTSYLRTSLGSAKALYNKKIKKNYSKKSAEYFVNTSKCKSKKGSKYLIWVSLYDQHLYVFKGKKGQWRIYDHWEVSSGKPSTPSPTGRHPTKGLQAKYIYKKTANRHGLGPWTSFQSWTSFHGKQRSWKLGSPQSGACIRNPNEKSRWIYKKIPMGTAVLMY